MKIDGPFPVGSIRRLGGWRLLTANILESQSSLRGLSHSGWVRDGGGGEGVPETNLAQM